MIKFRNTITNTYYEIDGDKIICYKSKTSIVNSCFTCQDVVDSIYEGSLVKVIGVGLDEKEES